MTSKQFVEGFAPLAFYESLIQQQERETARLTTLLKDVADDRAAHMRKWQDERAALMKIAPGYTYRNRVDDPEWEIAKAAILSAVASPASREARRAPPEPV
jgi:hypothetical protein